jgi:DNA-binding NarL/FixJ family response regulator
VSPFPAAVPIQVYAMRLEPLRAAGLQALFAHHSGIDIILEETRAPAHRGWLDPAVKVVLIGTQSGAGTLELVRSIRSARPEAPMIVMSPAAGDEAALAALNLGVKGFLHETATAEQLEEAVRTVASGSVWAPRRLLSRLIDRLLLARDTQATLHKPTFTAREQQVMDLLLEGQSNREIASCLDIEERTVKVYVTKLMRKMGVQNRTALSVRAISANRS